MECGRTSEELTESSNGTKRSKLDPACLLDQIKVNANLSDRQIDDLKNQLEPEVNDNDIHIKAQGGDDDDDDDDDVSGDWTDKTQSTRYASINGSIASDDMFWNKPDPRPAPAIDPECLDYLPSIPIAPFTVMFPDQEVPARAIPVWESVMKNCYIHETIAPPKFKYRKTRIIYSFSYNHIRHWYVTPKTKSGYTHFRYNGLCLDFLPNLDVIVKQKQSSNSCMLSYQS
jgi:hypothetical protein